MRQLMAELVKPKFRKWLAAKDPYMARRAELKAEQDDIADERQLNQADKAAKRISRATWMIDAQALDERQLAHDRAVAALPESKTHIDPDVVLAGWEELTLAEQRTLLQAVLVKVLILPATRGGNRFDPGRVVPQWRYLE